MKRIILILICLALMLFPVACGSPDSVESPNPSSALSVTPADFTVAGLKGPTSIGLAHLQKAAEQGTTFNRYTFSLYGAPDELVGRLVKGEVDFAALPTNLAASLYQKTKGDIQVLAVNTYGVLSILENGTSISSFSDLKGKTVYSTGEGANPEYVLRYLLTENGLDPDKDVVLKFVSSNQDLAGLLMSGKADVALTPEPVATTVLTKNDKIRRAIDLTAAWEEVAPESGLLMGCLVVSAKTLDEKPDAVRAFFTEYQTSVQAVSDTAETALLCEKYGIIESAAIAEKAIPNCHIGFLSGAEMKTKLTGYLQVLFEADPSSVGGSMPGEDFCYVD